MVAGRPLQIVLHPAAPDKTDRNRFDRFFNRPYCHGRLSFVVEEGWNRPQGADYGDWAKATGRGIGGRKRIAQVEIPPGGLGLPCSIYPGRGFSLKHFGGLVRP